MLIKYSLTRLKSLIWILLLLFPLVVTATEEITKDEVAKAVRSWYSAWNSGDLKAVTKFDAHAVGFGWRSAPWRDASAIGEEAYLQAITQLLEGSEYGTLVLDELHASVEGDIGLAWGVHTEDFKLKGQSPEKAHVRFTMVLKKSRGNWGLLLFHRDIQSFDEKGRYLREHTKISQEN